MANVLKLAAAAAVALAFAANAHAADAPGLWPQDDDEPSPQAREYRSGWYLRGDIGYRINRLDHVDVTATVRSHSIGNAVSAGAGAGFKHRWFRGDMTIDYSAPVKVKATTQGAAAQPQYTTSIDTTAILANGYFDLGTWYRLTPYVGAGAGVSYTRTYDYRNTALPNQLVQVGTKWNLAWAAMAGISYRILPRWDIDVGYRYLNLGNAVSAHDSLGNIATFRNISAQEVRVGFRYQLD
ncbi:MAG: porin family protein [Alphaproteobacteria bacterium]|nr:porin family protein [Alphaproteobacteria bacterium]